MAISEDYLSVVEMDGAMDEAHRWRSRLEKECEEWVQRYGKKGQRFADLLHEVVDELVSGVGGERI